MLASDTTRMLVLGVCVLFEPANGYQLRRELLSWNVQSWANVNPGSIYSMLATLAKQGLVLRHDLTIGDAVRPIAVYTTTPEGRKELKALVEDGLAVVKAFDQSAFYAALSLMPVVLGRSRVVARLTLRLKNLETMIAEARETIAAVRKTKISPPHVARLFGLAEVLPEAEREWVEGLLGDIRAGAMVFRGEPGTESWHPLPGDPAWRMRAEREQYLGELRRRGALS